MSLEDALGVNNVFVHDRWTGATTLVSVAIDGSESSGHSEEVSISADGRYVAFRSWASNLVNGDTNNLPDIFVRDLQTNQTTRVSVASDGTQANNFSFEPSISADGRYVAFVSWADNLVSGDTNRPHQDLFRFSECFLRFNRIRKLCSPQHVSITISRNSEQLRRMMS